MNILENIEVINKVVTLITSICFLIGVILAYFSFKYKLDAETRNLYVKNSEKILNVLKQICANGKASNESLSLLRDAKREAEIYLHKEVYEYIDNLSNKVHNLRLCSLKLERLPVGDKRNQVLDKEAELLSLFGEKLMNVGHF